MSQNPLTDARAQLDQVAEVLENEYDDNRAAFQAALKNLHKPQHLHEGNLEITMDSGKKQTFRAYRSQHCNALGPYKGGIRFHPDVSREEVLALSMWMTWKCGVVGIPYGGGKGGVIVNPQELSATELEALSRAYVQFLGEAVGPWRDIPAPDVNTTPEIMAWMADEWQHLHGSPSVNPLASFTGKPLELGGSEGRNEATGLGGVYVLQQLAQQMAWKRPQDVTIAIQGFGNVGYWFAYHADQLGYRVVAVSDSKQAVYVPGGLNPEKTFACKKETGTLSECRCTDHSCSVEHGEILTNEQLLELDVDVLVPAALENVITTENAQQIKAKVVIEMANGPVSPEAEKMLHEREILIVPDVLANAGGVSTSYFEWIQNLSGQVWSRDEVLAKLEPLMIRAFDAVWKRQQVLEGKTMRVAAYSLAVKRVIDAMLLRGGI
ncbi:MAG: Glu/Leu/Phe/Val dehydrogenase [Patescibacteria group bacterium]